MPLALAAVLGTVTGAAAWRWLTSGRYRRPDEDSPLPRHHWVLVAIPALMLLLAWRLDDAPWAVLLPHLLLAPFGLTLAAVDGDVHRLPNALTLPAIPVTAGLLLVAATTTGDWVSWRRALLAALVVGGGLTVLAMAFYGRFIGMGDAKLMGSLAMLLGWTGWTTVLEGVYLGLLLGGVAAVVLLLGRRVGWRSHLAFGPYLVAGAVLTVLGHGPSIG